MIILSTSLIKVNGIKIGTFIKNFLMQHLELLYKKNFAVNRPTAQPMDAWSSTEAPWYAFMRNYYQSIFHFILKSTNISD